MTAHAHSLEQRLLGAYRQQAERYEFALRIVHEQADATTSGAASDAWVGRLDAVLREIAGLDTALSQDKAAWRELGRAAGIELRAVLDGLAEQIGKLRQQI